MPHTKKVATDIQDKLTLAVTPRTDFGKKLKKLRRVGIVPGNIYGPDFKSRSVSVKFKDFSKVYKAAKQTGIVYLQLDSQELPVLIKNPQRHPVTDIMLHIDFRKIDLTKKIETNVPVKVVGQSEAVTQKSGVLLTFTVTLLVEALPSDIPRQIEVDISKLKELGQEIKVADLPKSSKYQIKDPIDKVVISVVAHKEESITPETAPTEAPEVITEAAKTEEGEEGQAPTEATGKVAVEGKPASASTKPSPVKKPAEKN